MCFVLNIKLFGLNLYMSYQILYEIIRYLFILFNLYYQYTNGYHIYYILLAFPGYALGRTHNFSQNSHLFGVGSVACRWGKQRHRLS